MTQDLVNKLKEMRMPHFLEECIRQEGLPEMIDLSFEERLALAIEAEYYSRRNAKAARLLKAATLWEPTASLKDYIYNINRNLSMKTLAEYRALRWAKAGRPLIIIGATGTGKTFILSGLGREGCEKLMRVKYYRSTELFAGLEAGRSDGSYEKKLSGLIKPDLLLLDDFGLYPLDEGLCLDFLEVIEKRASKKKAIAIGTQYPVANWTSFFANRTVADAIMDRLVHGAFRINLGGPSMREVLSAENTQEDSSSNQETDA